MPERIGRVWWAVLAGVIAFTISLLVFGAIANAAPQPSPHWHIVPTASAVCNTQTGEYDVSYKVVSWDSNYTGQVESRLGSGNTPITFHESVAGDSKASYLKTVTTWSNGEVDYDTIYAYMDGSCEGAVVDPKGSFDGPCGDPLYGISLDNSGSNVPVTFKLRYVNPIHGLQKRDIAVAAGDAGWWKGPAGKGDPTNPAYGRFHIKANTTLALRYVAGDDSGLIFKTATTRAHGAVCTLLEGFVGQQPE